MERPEGALSFCGYVASINATNATSIFHNECFIDAIRTIPHVLFTFFIIPPLIALNKGQAGNYHAKTWVHFPWHNLRWVLTFAMMIVNVLAIGEGFLSDSLYEDSHLHLFLPGIMSLLGTGMAIAFYHNIEVWNSPKFLQLALQLYWLMNLITEVLKVVCLSFKGIEAVYLRVHINGTVVLLYASLLLLEFDVRRRLRLFICYKKPNLPVPPEDLLTICYIHDRVSLLSRAMFFWIQRMVRRGLHGYIDWRDLGELPKEDQILLQMDHVENRVNMKQIFKDGLSLSCIYRQILHSSYPSLAIGFVTGLGSDLIGCFMPVILGFIIVHLQQASLSQDVPENLTLPMSEQYIEAAMFFSNGYILLTLLTILLIIATILKEASKQLLTRIGLKLNNIIKMIVIKKLLQIRVKNLPGFIDVERSARELVQGDWSALVLGLFSVVRYYIKTAVSYAIIYYYCGAISHVLVLVYLTGILLLLYYHYMNRRPVVEEDNLKYIRQLRLQGQNIMTAITNLIRSKQNIEAKSLRKPILLCSLYVGAVNATVIAIGIMIFPSALVLEDRVPAVHSVVVILLLLHYIRSAMPDLIGLLDLLNTRTSLRDIGNILQLTPVMGRTLKTHNSNESSEAEDPVTFSLEFRSRTPSPCKDNNHDDKQNPFLEAISKDLADTSTPAMELSEVTPMLCTITEEDGVEVKSSDKHVLFTELREKATSTSRTAPTSTEAASVVRLGMAENRHSSGGMSHLSDMDESIVNRPTRGVGVALDVQSAACTNTVSLKDISIKVDDGKLTIITGPKMSGKATLLDGILLGNIESMTGDIMWKSDTTVSYSGYPAWIMQATVMENILFGQVFDRHRYKRVLKACALQSDINSFPDRDLTMLRSDQQIVKLTDSQKNRITLARALYSRSDIVILNEPLCCMNVNKGSEIFEDGILKFLLKRKRTVILATQQIQFFPFAHMIYRMQNGEITHSGTLKDIRSADSKLFNRWQHIAKHIRQESYTTLSLSVNRDILSPSRKPMESGSRSQDDQDHSKQKVISPASSPAKYHTQSSHSSDTSDKSYDTGHREHMYSTQSSRELQDDLLDPQERGLAHVSSGHGYAIPKDYIGYTERSYIPRIVWRLICKSCLFVLCMFLVIPIVTLTVISYYYIILWNVSETSAMMTGNSTADTEIWMSSVEYTLSMWLCMGGIVVFMTVLVQFLSSYSGLHAAYTLHMNLTHVLMHCSVNSLISTRAKYFLSQIKDTKGIKQLLHLCEHLMSWIHCIVLVVSMVVVVCIACPYTIIPAVVLLIPECLAIIAHYCTARQLIALQHSSEASLVSNVHDCMSGLSVIRAYRQEEHVLTMISERLDVHTNVTLWRQALDSWLSIRAHILAAAILLLCGLGLVHDGSQEEAVSPYFMLAFIFCLLHYYIKELQLLSMHKVVEYCLSLGSLFRLNDVTSTSYHLAGKDATEPENLRPEWPGEGCITFVDVSLKYEPEDDPIIIGADFCISPGEKFGICGATGSGKSTLISSLVRISEVAKGTITIDDQCLTEVPNDVICSRLTFIPHDAVIYQHTARCNICPDGTKTDADIWNVLETVELKTVFEAFPGQLDQHLTDEFLNSTEKQQLLLAYALLRGSCVVVLDEVIRPENTTIRRILDHLFLHDWKHTTVVIATNQADFLLTVGQVVVLDSGRIVEQGQPGTLVKKKSPFFPPVDLH